MNFPAISPLICSILFIALGLFVFLKNPRSHPNQAFGLMCLVTFWWQFSWFILFSFGTERLARVMIHVGYTGIIFIPYTFYHFFVVFLKRDKEKVLVSCAYLLGFIFLIFNWTSDLYIKGYYRYPWGYYPKAGLLHLIYLLSLFSIAARITYLLYRELSESKSSPYRYNQIKYILCAFVIYTFASSDFAVNYGLSFYPLGFIFIMASLSIMAYTIIKYRLMDIKLARQYLAIYFFYGLISLTLFSVPILFLRYSITGIVFLVVAAFLVAPRLFQWTVKFLEPALLGETYHIRKQLDRLKESELGYLSEQIAWNLVEGVCEILQLQTASFFLWKKSHKEFRPQAQVGLDDQIGCEPICWVTLKPDDPLVKYLAKTKKPLVKDELSESDPAVQQMERLFADVSIPLFVRDELVGILNLGPKPNDEMYHHEDINKLTELCKQAENHLSHARFMEDRASFSRELAHDMKNLFTKAVMLTLGSVLDAKDPQKKDKEIKTLARQLTYTEARLEDNFDLISILERVLKQTYNFIAEHLKRIVLPCVSFYKSAYDKKGLSVTVTIPKGLPKVAVNQEDIPKVFNNLLDNALKSTQTGGVTIKAELKEGEVLITFSDTGRGIAKDDLNTLFEPKLKMPDAEETGTGLGLVIVRDIIEAHKGRIWVESEPDKGTTFYLTLPIAKDKKEA